MFFTFYPALVGAMSCMGFVCETHRSEHYASDSNTELFERAASRDGFGEKLGEFIEFLVHNFLSFLV